MHPRGKRSTEDQHTGSEGPCRTIGTPRNRFARLVIVLAGIILGQSLIYGPSLIGHKILLPLDSLAKPGVWVPGTNRVAQVQEWDPSLSDQVLVFEPMRCFAAREFRTGRLPLWSPNYYTGAPCVWSIFSPFALLECLIESPIIVAWKALLTAVVAGLGMYSFCRRALGVGFLPACICAWCYPLTGFLVVWQGYYARQTVCVLPWLLTAIDSTIRWKNSRAPISMSIAAGLAAWGQPDIAGQVFLISGIYALWCLWDEYGRRFVSSSVKRAVLCLALGWSFGLMMAAPQILPLLEYLDTGSRFTKRSDGLEERPPAGLVALPQAVFPDYYGRSTRDTLLISTYKPGNLQESAVGAYAGALVMLFAAPLAFCSKRHRSLNLFLGGLAVLGVGWILKVPVIVDVLRLPGLNMMSHNRLMFATGFAFVALAAVGLDALSLRIVRWKWRAWFMVLILGGLSGWCVHRAVILPEPVATQLRSAVSQGQTIRWVRDLADVHQVQEWFYRHSLVAAFICATGALLWLLIALQLNRIDRLLPVIALASVAELVWHAQKRQPQCDPALYYPRVPVLEQIAQANRGRVIGYSCLPANLASMAGLQDVRGYNGVDPAEITELLTKTADSRSTIPVYAQTQWLIPKMTFPSDGRIQFPPILSLLGVRFVVFRGPPSARVTPAFTSPDYYVWENTNALPRVFIPRRVEMVADRDARLNKLASPDFDPRQTAFVERAVVLPYECLGSAEINRETPTRVTIQTHMDTAGLVVLADSWDSGWRAFLNGLPVSILRADHALRGVVVPAGKHELEFRYEPASLAWGLWLAAVAVLTQVIWVFVRLRYPQRHPEHDDRL